MRRIKDFIIPLHIDNSDLIYLLGQICLIIFRLLIIGLKALEQLLKKLKKDQIPISNNKKNPLLQNGLKTNTLIKTTLLTNRNCTILHGGHLTICQMSYLLCF